MLTLGFVMIIAVALVKAISLGHNLDMGQLAMAVIHS